MATFLLCMAIGAPFFAYRAYVGFGNIYELIGFSVLSICCLLFSVMALLALPTQIAAALPVSIVCNRDLGLPQTVRKWVFKNRGLCPVQSMKCKISSLHVHRALAHRLGMQREFDQIVEDQTMPMFVENLISHESDLNKAIFEWLDSDGNGDLRVADFIHWGYALVAWCDTPSTDRSIRDVAGAIPIVLTFATTPKAMESIIQNLNALLPGELASALIDSMAAQELMNRPLRDVSCKIIVIEAC